MRKTFWAWNLVAILALGVAGIGCNAKQAEKLAREVAKAAGEARTAPAKQNAGPKVTPVAVQPGETITIASFNIRSSAPASSGNRRSWTCWQRSCGGSTWSPSRRSARPTTPCAEVRGANQRGRLALRLRDRPAAGRTNSKEQYAILFNTARIEVDRGSVYTVDDHQNLLHASRWWPGSASAAAAG